MLRYTALVLLLMVSQARADWIELKPVREPSNNSALADIISNCDNIKYYYDKDKITYGHEACHCIHARLRNSFKKDNGYYLLKGKAFLKNLLDKGGFLR